MLSFYLNTIMPNPFFKFKEFTVYQNNCAMKVCTDACILGAYTAEKKRLLDPKRVLDIGGGTGLLTLMLAQKLPLAQFDTVELDTNAYKQCTENIVNSPWKMRISTYHASIQSFAEAVSISYDLIITNPPFFHNHLYSSQLERQKARHTVNLDFSDLLQVIVKLLATTGSAFILLPVEQALVFDKMALDAGLFVQSRLKVRNREEKPFIRMITQYGYAMPERLGTEVLTVRNKEKNYSERFSSLLKEYYLIF